MSNQIHLSMTLRSEWRNPEGVAKTQEKAAALGLTPTTAGRATISCVAAPELFCSLFGVEAEKVPASEAGESDFGAPAGYAVAEDLPVPADLEELVESVSVEPPARRFMSR